MAPTELDKIEKVSTEMSLTRQAVEELRADVRVLLVKLFGDDEGENDKGRVPQIEAKLARHNERITRLEGIVLKGAGVILSLGCLASLVELYTHLAPLLRK